MARLLSGFAGIFGLKRSSPDSMSPAETHYHAVAVRPGAVSCENVMRYTGRRILSREAPPLPVSGCSLATCTCHYRHFKDRRAGPRRVTDHFNLPVEWSGKEKRAGRGRRTTDRLPVPPIPNGHNS